MPLTAADSHRPGVSVLGAGDGAGAVLVLWLAGSRGGTIRR